MRARVFVKHPDILSQMLVLRLQGWSIYALARKHEADKTTIEHWCDKFEIKPVFEGQAPMRQVTVISYKPVVVETKQYKYQHLFDEEDCDRAPKTYAQIRIDARRRELIKLGVLSR